MRFDMREGPREKVRIEIRGKNGVDNAQGFFDFACTWSDPIMNRLSQFLCARRDARGFERLRHFDRHGHVEPAGEAFRPGIDRRELAGTGSLSLPWKEQNCVVPDI